MLYGLGTTIGAGIYALTGMVAGRAGMQAPAAFLLASLLALFSALSFAELASRFPLAGGEAIYVREGFGWGWLSSAVGLLAVLSGLVSAATVSVGFVGYLSTFTPAPPLLASAGVVVVFGVVAAWGVRESVTVAGIITVVEVGGLLAVIGFGREYLLAAPGSVVELVPLDATSWRAVGSAAILAFYAFLGFEDMVNVAEEVRDVRRVMPRAILLTLVLTAALYGVLATVAVRAVPPEELAASDAPLSLVFERCGGPAPVLGAIAIVALLNGGLIQVVKASRVLYGLAGQGAVPARLGRVHPWTRTPLLATLLVTVATGAFATTLPLATLAETTSLVTLTTFTLANVSLALVKRREPLAPGSVSFPIWIPWVGSVLSAGFVIYEVATRL